MTPSHKQRPEHAHISVRQRLTALGRIIPRRVAASAAGAGGTPSARHHAAGYRLIRPAIALEFQPDAIEVEEAPPPRVAFLTLYAIFASIVCFFSWAAVAEIDRVVAAGGRVITTRPHIVLQPLETSLVRLINVRPGDTVRKGDILATLDPTFAEADLADLQGRHNSYQAEIRRLEAELHKKPLVLPDNPTPDDLLQASLYERRMASYKAQLESYKQDIQRGLTSRRSAEADVEVLTKRMGIADQIVRMRAELKEQQVGSQLNLLLASNDRLGISRDLERARNQMEEAEHLIRSGQAKLTAFEEEWGRQVATGLVELQRSAGQVAEQLRKVELREHMINMVAPEDAVVLSTAQKTTGAVVNSSEPLVTLVPLDAPLEGEVRIQPSDIGFISIGDPVRLKIDAFPYTKHGSAAGILIAVSNDTFFDEKSPGSPAFYRGRVQITEVDLRQVPANFRLIPGMTVGAEIAIGKRSILSYLTRPVTGAVSDAMRDSSL